MRARARQAVVVLFVFLGLALARSSCAAPTNYSDIWWNPSESGWGLTVADHQAQLFAVWYTYGSDGLPTWFVIPGGTLSADHRLFSGDIYSTTGPPYTGSFDASSVRVTKVGTASIDFASPALAAGTALFSYSIGAVSQAKQIVRQGFGDALPAWGTDFTDIYWDPAESGWGLTVSQHGSNAFAVLYTYDEARQPIFVVMPGGTFTGPASFSGDLYTTTGPFYGDSPWNPARVTVNKVGAATLDFDALAAGAKRYCDPGPCNGRLHGRIGNIPFDKWISPQPFSYSAPDTPPVVPACNIYYTEWSACSNGLQTRMERLRDPANCAGFAQLNRACETPATPQPCSYTYAPFGDCQPGGSRNRTVISSSPPNCTGSPLLSETCTYSPPCSYTYGAYGTCTNGAQTRTLLGASPQGCVGIPILRQACSGPTGLPPGFPANLPAGTYRLDASVCATDVGCFSSSAVAQNVDAAALAAQVTAILATSGPTGPGCSSTVSYSPFNGTFFTVTATYTCTSESGSVVSSTITLTITKL